jgi:large subunit ribosomal protein L29
MKAEEFREMSIDELHDTLAELKRKLFDLRAQSVTETLENNKAAKNARKDIARIYTVLGEMEKQNS